MAKSLTYELTLTPEDREFLEKIGTAAKLYDYAQEQIRENELHLEDASQDLDWWLKEWDAKLKPAGYDTVEMLREAIADAVDNERSVMDAIVEVMEAHSR
jgi:hypothetical protein